MIHIPNDRLCFGEGASLQFHMARDGKTGMPNAEFTRDRMVNQYPQDIRAWIIAKGDVEKMNIQQMWKLDASELWDMGYRRCSPELPPVSMLRPNVHVLRKYPPQWNAEEYWRKRDEKAEEAWKEPAPRDRSLQQVAASMSGWYRIGIVLSILWFISSSLWLQNNMADSASLGADYAYCLKWNEPDMEAFVRDHPWLQDEPVFSTKFRREWEPYAAELHLKRTAARTGHLLISKIGGPSPGRRPLPLLPFQSH
jgi:hypothetical protein